MDENFSISGGNVHQSKTMVSSQMMYVTLWVQIDKYYDINSAVLPD